MTTCVEGDLEISFPTAWNVRRFDGPSHGFSVMKAVDFIAESSDKIVFLEVKDPGRPSISESERMKLAEVYKSEQIDFDLKYKFRDSFLYEWACGRVRKPIHYWVLIALESLSRTQLGRRADALRPKLPVAAASPKDWNRNIAKDCTVFNMETWNSNASGCQVVRISTRNQPAES